MRRAQDTHKSQIASRLLLVAATEPNVSTMLGGVCVHAHMYVCLCLSACLSVCVSLRGAHGDGGVTYAAARRPTIRRPSDTIFPLSLCPGISGARNFQKVLFLLAGCFPSAQKMPQAPWKTPIFEKSVD